MTPTPRSRAWSVEPRPSRWRGVGWAVAWFLVIVLSGVKW
jgi:uncharacterized membrane protein YecN with MAPEG domain